MGPKKSEPVEPDKITKVTATAAAVSTIFGAISEAVHFPSTILYLLAYFAAAMLAWSLYTAKSPNTLRFAVVVLICATAGVATYAVQHRGTAPVQARQSVSAASPDNEQTLAASLDQGISPSNGSTVDACTLVSGQGAIPAGYEIWVATLNNGADGADTSEFFNIRQAAMAPGDGSWRTLSFGVGAIGSADVKYWIYVFLVPTNEGDVLEHTAPGTSLTSLMTDWAVISEVIVERNAENNC